ncbi:S8 family serine peptidase [Candidatus Woesearchaeota archaeon]|jgi:subtilisin family serine protease|nr:S8 family serine peptidase [Candidatus Woesearchaeota archaeon]
MVKRGERLGTLLLVLVLFSILLSSVVYSVDVDSEVITQLDLKDEVEVIVVLTDEGLAGTESIEEIVQKISDKGINDFSDKSQDQIDQELQLMRKDLDLELDKRSQEVKAIQKEVLKDLDAKDESVEVIPEKYDGEEKIIEFKEKTNQDDNFALKLTKGTLTEKIELNAPVELSQEDDSKKSNVVVDQKNELVNSFSGKVTKAGLEKLKNHNLVEKVIYNKAFLSTQLTDSVDLINATPVWDLALEQTQIKGSGETVCVIDTGIDYTHDALGGCDIETVTLTGSQEVHSLESDHPYSHQSNLMWQINKSGFTNISVHFTYLDLEPGYDYVKIYDGEGTLVKSYTGEHEDVWTPHVEGDTLFVELTSDEAVNADGFVINLVRDGTVAIDYNWSGCKVLAGYDFRNKDENPMDDNGHGTHCAGIVASEDETYMGVAPDANLVALKVLPSSGNGGTVGDLDSAIEWCVNNAAEYNISVITMSLGGLKYANSCDSELAFASTVQVVSLAKAAGITVFAASGNDNYDDGISYPACLSDVISIGNTNKDDEVHTGGGGSNSANILDLLAPGTSIRSTYLNGGFSTLSGTSMATPHVAGAAALMKQFGRLQGTINMTPTVIKDTFNSTGAGIVDSRNGLNKSRINVLTALLSLDNVPPLFIDPQTTDDSPVIGEEVNFTITVHDLNLQKYVFSWNESGEWVNDSEQIISGSETTLFSTKTISLEDGTIGWRYHAQDLTGAWLASNISTIKVNTKPIFLELNIDSSDLLNRTNGSLIFDYEYLDNETDSITDSYAKWYLNNSEQVSLENSSSILFGNTTKADVWTLSLKLFDGDFWSEWQNATITIENAAPQIATLSDIIFSDDSIYELNLSGAVSDLDEDSMVISSSTPANVTVVINQTNKLVSFTPQANFSGINTIQFNVTDGEIITQSNVVTINVTDNNTPPVATLIPNQSWSQNENLTLNLSLYFTDVDGGIVSYSSSAVSNITIAINDDTGIATLNPDSEFIGAREVIFYAQDNKGQQTGSNLVVLTLLDGTAPVVNLFSPINNSNSSAVPITFNFSVSDNYASSLNCSLFVNDSNSGQSVIATTTGYNQINNTLATGNYNWAINCSDGINSGISSDNIINVDRTAPVVTLISPANLTRLSSDTTDITFKFTDSSATANCSLYVGTTKEVTNASVLNNTNTTFEDVEIDSDGLITWNVTCEDIQGNSGGKSSKLYVPESFETQPGLIFVEDIPRTIPAVDDLTLTVRLKDTILGDINTSFFDVNPTSVATSSANEFPAVDIDKFVRIESSSTVDENIDWAYFEIEYSNSDLDDDINESSIKIYYANETSGEWQLEENSGVNTTENYAWANVTHFSVFTLGASEDDDSDDSDDDSSAGAGGAGTGSADTTSDTINIVPTPGGATVTVVKDKVLNLVLSDGTYSFTVISVSATKAYLKSVSKNKVVVLYLNTPIGFDVGTDGQNDITFILTALASGQATIKTKLGDATINSLSSQTESNSSNSSSTTQASSSTTNKDGSPALSASGESKSATPTTKGKQVNHFKPDEISGNAVKDEKEDLNSKEKNETEKKEEKPKKDIMGIFAGKNIWYFLIGFMLIVFVVAIDLFALSGPKKPKGPGKSGNSSRRSKVSSVSVTKSPNNISAVNSNPSNSVRPMGVSLNGQGKTGFKKSFSPMTEKLKNLYSSFKFSTVSGSVASSANSNSNVSTVALDSGVEGLPISEKQKSEGDASSSLLGSETEHSVVIEPEISNQSKLTNFLRRFKWTSSDKHQSTLESFETNPGMSKKDKNPQKTLKNSWFKQKVNIVEPIPPVKSEKMVNSLSSEPLSGDYIQTQNIYDATKSTSSVGNVDSGYDDYSEIAQSSSAVKLVNINTAKEDNKINSLFRELHEHNETSSIHHEPVSSEEVSEFKNKLLSSASTQSNFQTNSSTVQLKPSLNLNY